MPRYGARSKRELETIHPDLRQVLLRVIEHIDHTILKGRRGRDAQNAAYETGRSGKRWPDSMHNCPVQTKKAKATWAEDPDGKSLAVDIAPWPIDWHDLTQFAYLAGQIVATGRELGVDIRWGGDWDGDGQGNWRDPDNYFDDLVHFELVRK